MGWMEGRGRPGCCSKGAGCARGWIYTHFCWAGVAMCLQPFFVLVFVLFASCFSLSPLCLFFFSLDDAFQRVLPLVFFGSFALSAARLGGFCLGMETNLLIYLPFGDSSKQLATH